VIDRLAAEGMLFENAYCNNSICTPSRSSILTSQYPLTNRVPARFGIRTSDYYPDQRP